MADFALATEWVAALMRSEANRAVMSLKPLMQLGPGQSLPAASHASVEPAAGIGCGPTPASRGKGTGKGWLPRGWWEKEWASLIGEAGIVGP